VKVDFARMLYFFYLRGDDCLVSAKIKKKESTKVLCVLYVFSGICYPKVYTNYFLRLFDTILI
jgi:hypothetical protein